MTERRSEADSKMNQLNENTSKCVNKLCGQLELAAKIETTAEICRKLETEKEKVIP